MQQRSLLSPGGSTTKWVVALCGRRADPHMPQHMRCVHLREAGPFEHNTYIIPDDGSWGGSQHHIELGPPSQWFCMGAMRR